MIGWMLPFSLPFSESLNVLNPLKNKKIKKFSFFFSVGVLLCFLMDLTGPPPGINNEWSLRSLALSVYDLLAILVSNLLRGWDPGFLAVGEGGLFPNRPPPPK